MDYLNERTEMQPQRVLILEDWIKFAKQRRRMRPQFYGWGHMMKTGVNERLRHTTQEWREKN
jgi:hypothetical protein